MKSLLLPLVLVSALASAAQIIVAPDAPPAEQTAARELAKYLNLISGGTPAFRIASAADAKDGGPVLHVGQGPAALRALGIASWKELHPDEVLYCVQGREAWLAGAAPRGTLYAVYEFLEREYGVRFYTSEDELVPRRVPFRLPKSGTRHRYAPPFLQRCPAYFTVAASPAFAAKLRCNHFNGPKEAAWGGSDELIGWCHTLAQFLPAETYFARHPEWYSLRDGRRQGGPVFQMCLTNRAMRRELVRVVRERLKANPGSHIISVSQNDNLNWCQCPDCEAFVRRHGNQTDLLIDCVNEVAAAIAQDFPEVFCETLAYQYTRQPPRTVRPRPNVAIRYCTGEAASFAPIDSPRNAALARDLKAWRKIASHMMIWNYLATFGRYYIPHPNWECLDQDVRLFRDCHAISVFEQGAFNHTGRAADLADLRAYVVARLLWNPDLSAQTLIQDFVSHHYGPAAPCVFAYLDGVTDAARRHPDCLDNCGTTTTDNWLDAPTRARLWADMFAGVEKFARDPIYGPRLAIAALPITMDLLDHPHLLTPPPESRLAPLRRAQPLELLDFCEKYLELAGASQLNEGLTLNARSWLASHRERFGRPSGPDLPSEGPRPPELPPRQTWWGWNAETVGRLISPSPRTIALDADPVAVGGKAVRMPAIHHEWYLQMARLPAGRYELCLTVRCTLKPGHPAHGDALTCGNHPFGPNRAVSARELAGPGYKLIRLGPSDIANAECIYCAPVVNPNVESVWIDRLILLPIQ